MIFNEIKCHVNTSLGLVGGCIPCTPPANPVYHFLTRKIKTRLASARKTLKNHYV